MQSFVKRVKIYFEIWDCEEHVIPYIGISISICKNQTHIFQDSCDLFNTSLLR